MLYVKNPQNRTCLIWRHIVPEHMMPDGQFAVYGATGQPIKTVFRFCTHVIGERDDNGKWDVTLKILF